MCVCVMFTCVRTLCDPVAVAVAKKATMVESEEIREGVFSEVLVFARNPGGG